MSSPSKRARHVIVSDKDSEESEQDLVPARSGSAQSASTQPSNDRLCLTPKRKEAQERQERLQQELQKNQNEMTVEDLWKKAPKDLAIFYFTYETPSPQIKISGSGWTREDRYKWECLLCSERVVPSPSGYSNQISHLKTRAKHIPEDVLSAWKSGHQSGETGTITSYFECSRTGKRAVKKAQDSMIVKIFGWLEWIIMSALPISFCQNKYTRKYTCLNTVSVNTLKKYMSGLTVVVENRIASLASQAKVFALIFDGWSENFEHFIGLFISFGLWSGTQFENHRILLAFAPLLDETQLNAQNHVEFIKETLTLYKLDINKLLCLIGDNCSTNVATANLLGVPLIGCCSH
ncbi:hypothetical protein BDR26DRAFT_954536 [Obelidium mucronatum]|nr:hypothetical protein BDR26DRAFT_954536 [Obelidium mucronatum]